MPACFAPPMVAVGERTCNAIHFLVFLAGNKNRSLTPITVEIRQLKVESKGTHFEQYMFMDTAAISRSVQSLCSS
jgi:hypothetical protein